ncbi:MAG: hypothetical protein Q7S16_01895 [bacterium]|nr:hypothetical protein [bacterium]
MPNENKWEEEPHVEGKIREPITSDGLPPKKPEPATNSGRLRKEIKRGDTRGVNAKK